jgi:hypothetical protein
MKKTSVRMLLCSVALCSTALFAQERANGLKRAYTPEKSNIHVPAVEPATVKIYTNLGSATDAYNDQNGFDVAGPASTLGQSQFIGLPFTPKADSHVTEIQAAVQYDNAGANQVRLSLYTDAAGVPGTIIAGPQTIKNLGIFGTCCTLTSWKLRTPVAVTAATQYWVVADTPATGAGDDFFGVWDFVFTAPLQAYNVAGGGWTDLNGFEELPAGQVMGTVP